MAGCNALHNSAVYSSQYFFLPQEEVEYVEDADLDDEEEADLEDFEGRESADEESPSDEGGGLPVRRKRDAGKDRL